MFRPIAANGFNLPSGLLPNAGYTLDDSGATDRPLGQWDSANTSFSLTCIGENDVVNACHEAMVSTGAIPPSTAAYEFKLASWAAVDNPPVPLIQNSSALYGQPFLQLAAGQSIDLLLGIATPKAALVGQTYAMGMVTGGIYFVGLSQPDRLTGQTTPLYIRKPHGLQPHRECIGRARARARHLGPARRRPDRHHLALLRSTQGLSSNTETGQAQRASSSRMASITAL